MEILKAMCFLPDELLDPWQRRWRAFDNRNGLQVSGEGVCTVSCQRALSSGLQAGGEEESANGGPGGLLVDRFVSE